MRLLEIDLPYFEELWQNWRWKLFLTSGSETQGPLVKIKEGGLDLFYFYFYFYFLFYFLFIFYFLFLEQLGLGLIGHAITLVT